MGGEPEMLRVAVTGRESERCSLFSSICSTLVPHLPLEVITHFPFHFISAPLS